MNSNERVMQVKEYLENRNTVAAAIANQWSTWHDQMDVKRQEWAELQKYLFATDTTTTSNSNLPWKNKTTLPKLAQIRDNLHSNYIKSLFPNDKWLTWHAYTEEAATKEKARKMTAYMDNKLRESHFRTTVSRLVYDWIDTGNAFAMTRYVKKYAMKFGEKVPDYVGPKLERISPYDICFDLTASSFKYTPKIIRSMNKLGDIAKWAHEENNPDGPWAKFMRDRHNLSAAMSGLKTDEWEKVTQFEVDGFGSLQEYYGSHYVEVLDFYGDWYNVETNEYTPNRHIVIVDRTHVIIDEPIQTYNGTAPIFHVGWRMRPDNLMAMGPLDNLVGMQYRLDHIENLKADAMDLIIHPPLKIIGEVEEFQWGPGVPIHIDEQGDVQELTSNITSFAVADNDMSKLEDRMELYAGAPREAMGMRTPGEKTAFEVDSLQNAAASIRQEKVNLFETEMLEQALNSMMEQAHANLDAVEQVGTVSQEDGIQEFLSISKADFTAGGILRPVGARHFAQQAQDLLNLNQLFSGPMGQMIMPHTSSVELSNMIENVMNLRGYEVFKPNVALEEQAESQSIVNMLQEDMAVQNEMPDLDNEEEVPQMMEEQGEAEASEGIAA